MSPTPRAAARLRRNERQRARTQHYRALLNGSTTAVGDHHELQACALLQGLMEGAQPPMKYLPLMRAGRHQTQFIDENAKMNLDDIRKNYMLFLATVMAHAPRFCLSGTDEYGRFRLAAINYRRRQKR